MELKTFDLKSDLLIFMDSNQYSIEDVSLETGLPVSTIENILLGKGGASPLILECCYQCFHKRGLALNSAKEEIWLENYGKTLLFHGSKDGLTSITPNGSRSDCDLGPGFYLGESYQTVGLFVYQYPNSSVYPFLLDESGLKIEKLDCDLSWMIAVAYYRGKIKEFGNHNMVKKVLDRFVEADVIVAPIADNRMFYVMRQFTEGEITDLEALHCLSASGLGHQCVLKSQKAIDHLTNLDRLYICSAERELFDRNAMERSKVIDAKLKLAKREFRGQGNYIEDIFG